MKRTTQCLLVLLAMSCACATNLSQLADSFNPEVGGYQLAKVSTHSIARDFFPNLSKLIRSLVNDVVIELFRQLRLQSHILANSINSVNDELQYELHNSTNGNQTMYIERLVSKLNVRLGKYLELGPGPLNATMKKLPPIKDIQHVEPFVNYYPLKTLFSELGPILDINLSNVNAHIDNFYKDGWRASRNKYSRIQEDFRREYLNGYLLDAYGKVVVNTFNDAETIQKHVKAETWQQFVRQGSQIKRLYEEIQPVVAEGM